MCDCALALRRISTSKDTQNSLFCANCLPYRDPGKQDSIFNGYFFNLKIHLLYFDRYNRTSRAETTLTIGTKLKSEVAIQSIQDVNQMYCDTSLIMCITDTLAESIVKQIFIPKAITFLFDIKIFQSYVHWSIVYQHNDACLTI